MHLKKAAIFLLWLGAVIDPIGNTFGIRYLALATACAAIIWSLATGSLRYLDSSYRGFLIVLLAGVFPVHGLLLYSFHASNQPFIDTSYIAAGILMATSLLYSNRQLCEFGLKSFVLSARVLVFLVISVYASTVFSVDGWFSFLTERNVALISYREYSGIALPYVYFLASPLLILLLAYDLGRFSRERSLRSLLWFALTTFSFVLTGTRAHILIGLLFVPLYLLLTGTTRSLAQAAIMFSAIAFIVLTTEETRSLIGAFLSSSEASNSIKLSMLDGYGEIFSSIGVLIGGQGFNAHEWSLPLREMIAMEVGASKTELTYLELIRTFGIVLASAFICTLALLLGTIKKLGNDLKWLYPGFAIFLVNAAINPYLFSVNGMLPLGLAAAIAHHFRDRHLNENVLGVAYGHANSLVRR